MAYLVLPDLRQHLSDKPLMVYQIQTKINMKFITDHNAKVFILRSITLLWLLQLHLLTSCQAQSAAGKFTVTIMPLPAKTEVTNDHFWLKEKFVIAATGPEGKMVNKAVKQ